MSWLTEGVRKGSARLIVDFMFTHGVLLDGRFEVILHLDIISGGKVVNTAKEGMEARAERRRGEMTRQMADWRLSPWEETRGSQLGQGTVICGGLDDQSSSSYLIMDLRLLERKS